MITGFFYFELKTTIFLAGVEKKTVKNCLLESSFLSWEKKFTSRINFPSLSSNVRTTWLLVSGEKPWIVLLSFIFSFSSFCSISLEKKTARIRVNPWMFRLPFTVYGLVLALQKLIKVSKKEHISKINLISFQKILPHTLPKATK